MSDESTIAALIDMLGHIADEVDVIKRALAALSPAPPAPKDKYIPLPWISQLGPQASYAPGDCGAACVAMLVNWRGKSVTVDDVGKAISKPPGYGTLSFNELIAAAAKFGVDLQYNGLTLEQMRAEIDAGRPVIALVNYRSIPLYARYDTKYNGGHYLLLIGYGVGYVIYHDPLWPQNDKGAYKQMADADFLKAYTTIAPGNQHAPHALRLM